MHMGMLVAIIFALVRGGVALIPPLALRVQGKDRGGRVPAHRRLLPGAGGARHRDGTRLHHGAVMLVAILMDRQALTLRSSRWRADRADPAARGAGEPRFPDEFRGGGGACLHLSGGDAEGGPGPWRWLMPAVMLVLSSLWRGWRPGRWRRRISTGCRISDCSPTCCRAGDGPCRDARRVAMALLAPLGLAAPAAWVAEMAQRWILGVSAWVAGWRGRCPPCRPPRRGAATAGPGAVVMLLWQGRGRWAGVAPMLLAAALWQQAERPVLLIADTGGRSAFWALRGGCWPSPGAMLCRHELAGE